MSLIIDNEIIRNKIIKNKNIEYIIKFLAGYTIAVTTLLGIGIGIGNKQKKIINFFPIRILLIFSSIFVIFRDYKLSLNVTILMIIFYIIDK